MTLDSFLFRELAMIGKSGDEYLVYGKKRVYCNNQAGTADAHWNSVLPICRGNYDSVMFDLLKQFWIFLLSAGDVYNEEEHTKYCIICGSVFLLVLKREIELNHKLLLFKTGDHFANYAKLNKLNRTLSWIDRRVRILFVLITE